MATANEGAAAKRAAEIRASLQFFATALQLASTGYSPEPPDQARTALRIALAGVIKLISDLFPDEPSFPAPLIQLRQDLDDLERGRVSKLFKAKKVANRPPLALSEGLFRAIVAAAMTRLMEGRRLSRDEAARDVARRLSRMGAKHSCGTVITDVKCSACQHKLLPDDNAGVVRAHCPLCNYHTTYSGRRAIVTRTRTFVVNMIWPERRRAIVKLRPVPPPSWRSCRTLEHFLRFRRAFLVDLRPFNFSNRRSLKSGTGIRLRRNLGPEAGPAAASG